MARLLRTLGLTAVGALAVATGAALGGLYWVYHSLPSWSGSVTVTGANAPIRIVRDAGSIPHVLAENEPDAYFGLGYVHAQDRLWQLELYRRLASGRLAEIFGKDALPRDRLFRTLGFRRTAERNLEHLDTATRAALDGYVAGINAYLAQGEPLPPELGLLGVEPEAWTVVDSLVWLKMMAWNLSGNLDAELWRWRLSDKLTPREISEIFAPYPGDEPIVLDSRPSLYGDTPRPTGQWTPRGSAASGLGSNNWVIDGHHTQSGKPLLANDPHLGLSTPSIWYLAHLSAPGLNVVGATMPSLPGVILGHNDSVAWAFTNTGSDTQDLFVEQLLPDDPSRYLTPDGPAPFEVREELLHVKGGPDETLRVRISRHGPVLSDVYERATDLTPAGHVLALAWTALLLDDTTPAFSLAAAHARDASELSAAARKFQSPTQNIVFADSAGEIGFVAAGRVPIRAPGNALRGLWPAPGWQRDYDWQGFIPPESWVEQRNPPSGHIVTANQKITPPDYPYWLGFDWAEPYRANRIEQLLAASPAHDMDGFARMQLDVESEPARLLLPLLLDTLRPGQERLGAEERAALARLGDWNLEMRAGLVQPLIFSAWLRELARLVYADELGEMFPDAWGERIGFLRNVLSNQSGQSHWCDDIGTPAPEACPERIAAAFSAAIADLTRRYGKDVDAWTWGRAHQARARHFPMTRVPVLRDWFDIVSPTDGATHTINVGAYDLSDDETPFESHHAAGFRAVYDLSNLGASRFLINTGQSGHVLSRHYRDWVEPWARGALLPVATDRSVIEAGAADVLTLTPKH